MSNLQINQLPQKPGIYFFKNRGGRVIYVGKALNIRRRVKSYFHPKAQALEFKTARLLATVAKVDYIEVALEIEALLLEANLIKKYQPQYNTRLKDDKSYLYIKITTGDDFPKVLTARREKLPGVSSFGTSQNTSRKAQYFGPFPSAKTVKDTLKSLRRIFPYCNCRFSACQKRKSCFYAEIGLDAGPCLGLISRKDYRKIIRRLTLLLEGKKEKLLSELKKEMQEAGEKEEFEKAQALKKQIEGLDYLTRLHLSPAVYLEEPEYLAKKREEGLLGLKRLLGLAQIPKRIECFDISDIHGKEATGSMVVFQKGEADKSRYRRFKVHPPAGGGGKPNDVAMMKEIIGRRLKHPEWPPADLIMVDGGKGQVGGAREVLKQAGLQIPVIGLAKRLEEVIVAQKQWNNLPAGKAGGTMKQFATIRLPSDSPALHLLQAIRDEAHRFALTYHRQLRIKSLAI